MKEVIPKTVKIFGVLCFSALVGYQMLSNSFNKSSAIDELKKLKLIEITLLEEMSSHQNKTSKKKELLEETELCLSKMSQISNYRFGEEVTWKAVIFASQEQEHQISYAELSSGKIVLGVEYLLKNSASGESVNLGGGRGMSSDCLGNIFNRF